MNVHLYFYPRPWQTLGMGFAYLSLRLENKSYMQLSMVGNFEGPSWGGGMFSKFLSMDSCPRYMRK